MIAEPEILVESPSIPANPPLAIVPKGKGKRFTSENARIAAAKSHEVRRRKRAEFLARLNAPTPAQPESHDAQDYVKLRLVCVRAQIGKLDKQILTTRDPQALNWLASAQAKLAEQERILSGRPLPGNLRPKSPRASNPGSSAPPAPLD